MLELYVFILIAVGLIMLYKVIDKARHSTFNKVYYKCVYKFDYDLYDELDAETKYEYYILLIKTRETVKPTSTKDTIFNKKISRFDEIISYIEKKYPQVCL